MRANKGPMPSAEVKRTLVKSPPELWAELSDPAALSRHLGELGKIRVTRVEPESTVEWEADAAHGTIHIKQSGWGTKVTLSIVREAPAPPEPIAVPEPEAGAPPPEIAEAEPYALTPEPEVFEPGSQALGSEPEAVEPEPGTGEPEPETIEPEPEPRLGFFKRLFRRRRTPPTSPQTILSEPSTEPTPALEPDPALESESTLGAEPTHKVEPTQEAEPTLALEPEPTPVLESEPALPSEPTPEFELEPTPEPESQQAPQPEPALTAEPALTREPASEPTPDLATELAAVEAAMAEQDTALLTAVLDRLGAAHHRPFSRG